MEHVANLFETYGYLLYLIILVWTFVEGETIVIIAGALATDPSVSLSVELIALCALGGSFAGDQLYYYIGRRWGRSLLDRFPKMADRSERALELLRERPRLFILSFRFVYGVRNVAPFIIGMAGIPRTQYFLLNLLAATVWAHAFAWGGYLLGYAFAEWLGANKFTVLAVFLLVGSFMVAMRLGNKKKVPAAADLS